MVAREVWNFAERFDSDAPDQKTHRISDIWDEVSHGS